MNDEQASNFMPVIKFRILNLFLPNCTASSPILSSLVVASFHVTACGGPLQTHRTVGRDSDVRHSVRPDVVADY